MLYNQLVIEQVQKGPIIYYRLWVLDSGDGTVIQGFILIAIFGVRKEFFLMDVANGVHLIGVFASLWINMVTLWVVLNGPVSFFQPY